MRHRHALHTGLAAFGAGIGLCCSSAAPPPPPPPPEPTPIATPAAAPAPAPTPRPAAVASSAPRSGPDCPSDCKGAPTPALVSALRGRSAAAKACYQRALREAGVKGLATVHLTVTQAGVGCGVDVDLPDDLASMRSCIRELFAGSSFPSPGGSCARVNIPLNFEMAERDGGTDASR